MVNKNILLKSLPPPLPLLWLLYLLFPGTLFRQRWTAGSRRWMFRSPAPPAGCPPGTLRLGYPFFCFFYYMNLYYLRIKKFYRMILISKYHEVLRKTQKFVSQNFVKFIHEKLNFVLKSYLRSGPGSRAPKGWARWHPLEGARWPQEPAEAARQESGDLT